MGVRTRIEGFDKSLRLTFAADLAPEARSRALASAARDGIETAAAQNERVLGARPPVETFVDGVRGAALERVKPDGTIVAEFVLVQDALRWIAEQLALHSPVLTGRYRASHILFADDAEVPAGSPPPAAGEYVFLSPLPYARKIEAGRSNQAPDGVYEAVAALANRRFGNLARIRFTYRALASAPSGKGRARDNRRPAIVVGLR